MVPDGRGGMPKTPHPDGIPQAFALHFGTSAGVSVTVLVRQVSMATHDSLGTRALRRSSRFVVGLVALAILGAVPLQAEQHTARRLGHPSTRFADPVQTPEELRARLSSDALSADVEMVLNLCDGWRGDMADFRQAVATAPITGLQIPVGTRLPAMSSRKNGRPIVIREVWWRGTEPIDAYEFSFYSKGSHYRCVTPKACCNFWVENIGPDDRTPVLALSCGAPELIPYTRPLQVCLTVKNTGEVPADQVTVALPIPEGAEYAGPAVGSNPGARRMVWRIPRLAAGASKELCTDLSTPEPCLLNFASSATAANAEPVDLECTTRVTGIAAVLFEVIDIADPIEVGQPNTYEISVINQGSHPLTNVRIVCTLEESQEFVTGSGASAVAAEGRTVTSVPLAELAPKATAAWQLVVKALAAGDVRFAARLTSDECERPVDETESTRQY